MVSHFFYTSNSPNSILLIFFSFSVQVPADGPTESRFKRRNTISLGDGEGFSSGITSKLMST